MRDIPGTYKNCSINLFAKRSAVIGQQFRAECVQIAFSKNTTPIRSQFYIFHQLHVWKVYQYLRHSSSLEN